MRHLASGLRGHCLERLLGAGQFALPVVAAHSGNFSRWFFLFCALLVMTVVLWFSRATSSIFDTGGADSVRRQAIALSLWLPSVMWHHK